MSATKQTVLDTFASWVEPFEGSLAFMYCDQLGLVTVGLGFLVDPIQAALAMPWIVPGRGPATADEVRAAWTAVKARQDLKMCGGAIYHTVGGNVVRLTQSTIDAVTKQKLATNETILVQHFPAFAAWNADSQLALHSLAWAMGPSFAARFPAFTASCNAVPPDWIAAAPQSHMSNGAVQRNLANARLLLTAADVDHCGLDPEVIHGIAQPLDAA